MILKYRNHFTILLKNRKRVLVYTTEFICHSPLHHCAIFCFIPAPTWNGLLNKMSFVFVLRMELRCTEIGSPESIIHVCLGDHAVALRRFDSLQLRPNGKGWPSSSVSKVSASKANDLFCVTGLRLGGNHMGMGCGGHTLMLANLCRLLKKL